MDCDSDRYIGFITYAVIMILIYPLGIPLFYGVLLFKSRKALRNSAAMDR